MSETVTSVEGRDYRVLNYKIVTIEKNTINTYCAYSQLLIPNSYEPLSN